LTRVFRDFLWVTTTMLKSSNSSILSLLGKFFARILAVVLSGFFAFAFLPMAAQAQQIEVQGANSLIIVNNDTTPQISGAPTFGDGTDYGDVPVGGNVPGGSFFLVNRSLGTNLNITSVTVTGTNAGDFTVLGSPDGSVIAANGEGSPWLLI